MSFPPLTPIVIGVGDVVNHSLAIQDATEPLHLMLQAIQKAMDDPSSPSTTVLQSSVDSIDVIPTWTWPYPDLPSLLAKELGITPPHQNCGPHGGNQPAKLFDEAAQRITRGESSVALIVGGEALASLSACAAAGALPPPGWTELNQSIETVFSPTTSELGSGLGALHSVGHPIQIYPLYENALRAQRRQSVGENHQESARMYAGFAKVAAEHPFSWSFGKTPATEEAIGAVTKRNRMICFPYPLLMNAFNTVNLAAACLLTSTAKAKELGIPKSKWVYPLAGAGAQENSDFWLRSNFHSSPAISKSLNTCIRSSGLSRDEIHLHDIYSCFPIVPKLACSDLGLSIAKHARSLTLLGGLTSFGGAGNNYSMHAINELTRQLREKKAANGLVLANGGVLTYQHAVILSSRPRRDGSPYPTVNTLSGASANVSAPTIAEKANGDSVIETYTVDFSRNGSPLRGHIVGRLTASNHRFIANHGDAETLKQLSSWEREPIGRMGLVRNDEESGRNLFTFEERGKL